MEQRDIAHRLDKLEDALSDLRAQMAALVERIDALCQLRAANGNLAQVRWDAFIACCDERHAELATRLRSLEDSDRRAYGWRQKVAGMGVPVAICVSIIAVILGSLR